MEAPFDSTKSPFMLVNDEDVFITRQKEEQSRKSMRLSSANAHVYEKTTATTRAPLSRVRESDISPKRQVKMPEPLYNLKQRGVIAAAM
jgi:hypothetical protein